MTERTGGVLRLLRAMMGFPMVFPITARDRTLLSQRQATALTVIFAVAMVIVAAQFWGLAMGGR